MAIETKKKYYSLLDMANREPLEAIGAAVVRELLNQARDYDSTEDLEDMDVNGGDMVESVCNEVKVQIHFIWGGTE